MARWLDRRRNCANLIIMTHVFSRRAVLGAFVAAPFVTPAWAAPRTFVLDRARTEVRFSYYIDGDPGHCSIGVSDADFQVDLADLARSRVSVSLDPRSIRAGFLPATEALKSAQLLDAARHPVIRFASTGIQASGAGGQIAGDLTIKGVRRVERFTAQFINTIPDANATSFGIQLSGQVDRNAYGVSGYSSFVGPRVDLRIRAYLNAA